MLPMSGRAASLTSSIASARSDFEALVAVFAVLPKNLQRRIRSPRQKSLIGRRRGVEKTAECLAVFRCFSLFFAVFDIHRIKLLM